MTEEDYKFWDAVVKDCQQAVDKAKAELKVNSLFLTVAEEKRDIYDKPKEERTNTTNTN